MVQGLPPGPQPYPPQQSQPRMAQPAAQPATANAERPYSSGTTAYGAPLPRNIAMPQQSGAMPAEGGYTLGPGDKVRVTIFGEADLSGEYQVDGNGNIRLPLMGMTRAVGNTAGGLEAAIRAALVPNYLRDPRINVEITAYRPVYVVGAVQKPGQYAYVNDMTLLNAVALAGGFTPQARESTVYVRHEGGVEERVFPTNEPLLIRPGDTVRVDTTLFWDAVNLFGPLTSPIALAATVR
jgi:polysaccharide export outer membrane protein